jgi:hypothetical protein
MANNRRKKREGDKQDEPVFEEQRRDSERGRDNEREVHEGARRDENPNWWRNEGGGSGEVH